MSRHTLSIITGVIFGGVGFLFFGTVLTRYLEGIETPILIIFGILTIFFAVVIQIVDKKQSKKETKQQIHDVTGTIDGENI